MADNAAQSIKELQERLVSADKTLGEMIQRLGKYESWMSTIFSGIAKDAKVSIDEIADYLTKKMRRENLKQSESLMKDILGIEDAKKEVEKVPTMFERVIAQINQRAEQQKGTFAKRLFDAENAEKEIREIALTYAKSLGKLKTQTSTQSFLTEFGRENSVNQILLKGNVSKIAQDVLHRYQEALQRVIQVQEQLNQSQQKFASNVSAVEGVTRRYNDNEQALAKLQQRWEELNVRKQAGLINEKDFKTQTQQILDEYDRLIAKRKEFEIGDLGQMSSQRQRQREEEENRLAQLRKSNTQARLDDEMRAEKMIKQARAERAKKEAEADANMKKAVSQQVTSYKQLSALLKQYNSLKQVKGRTQEEEAALERTRQKIKEIIAEMRKLDSEQKGSLGKARDITEYDRILAKDREITNEKKKQNDLTKQQKTNLNNLLPTLQRLASAFGVAFSVRGLAQFGKKLIETRGEFERQQVALRSILQNKQTADEIWDKTMQAALQSPFTAMQLTTYTKQLAAYRIENEKLFDTTKRLADVSAGLGVDMQRLILAYGQVKAANYLRASEIRQFTEAGVNVLGELSRYLSEVKGQAISTAQVMEMVTKRMVTFEDVEAIFKRMTDEGGTFFNMQYVQSQTVKGQIAKLHDAYDQMLNSLGQANEGVLKTFVAALNNIVKNWKTWRVVLDSFAFPLLISSVFSLGKGLFSVNAAVLATDKSISALTRTGAKLNIGIKKIFASLSAHPTALVISALIAAAGAVFRLWKNTKEYNEEIEKQNLVLYESRQKLSDYEERVKANNATIEEYGKKAKKSKEEQESLSKAQSDNAQIVASLRNEYPELVDGLSQQANGYVNLTNQIDAHNRSLREQIGLNQLLKKKGWFSDAFGTDAEDFFTRVSKDVEEVRGKIEEFNISLMQKGINKQDLPPVLQEILSIDWSNPINGLEKYNQLLYELYSIKGEKEGFIIDELLSRGDITYAQIGNKSSNAAKSAARNTEEYKEFILEYAEAYDILGHSIDMASHAYTEFAKEFTMPTDEGKPSVANTMATLYLEELKAQIEALPRGKDDKNGIRKQIEQWLEEENQDLASVVLKHGADINRWTEEGLLTANETTRQVLIDQGKAVTKDRQKVLNEELKVELAFLSKQQEIAEIRAQIASEQDKKRPDMKRIKELREQVKELSEGGLGELDLFSERKGGSGGSGGSGGKGGKGNASKLISLIKEMRSEYDKLSKSAYGYAKSEEKVRESYKDSVKEILGKAGITDYDFTTNEGMIKALEKVKSYATKLGKDAAAEVQKYIDQLETEIEINAQVRIREDFGKQMEKAFNDYELTLELDKLNLPKGLAADMWGIEETDLQDLRKKLSQMYMGLRDENGQLSDEAFKDYEKFLNKIDDLERKLQKERLKDYSKYLEAQYSERVKIEMDYVRKLAALEAETAIKEPKKREIREGLKREFLEKSRKQDWEDFKGSEFYVGMMEDLEKQGSASLEVMRKKLVEMRENAENLSPRALKEVVNALEKIDELEKKRIPPLKRIREEQEKLSGIEIKDVYKRIAANQEKLAQDEQEQKDLERMIMLEEERQKLEKQGITLEEAKARLARSEQALSLILPSLDTRSDGTKEAEERRRILTETVNQAKKEVENWAEIVRILSGQATIDEQERGSKYKGLSLSDLKKRRDDAKQRIKDLEGLIGKDEELVKAQKDLEDAWNDTWEAAKRWAQSINGIFDGVMDTVGYFSDSTSTLTDGWKEFGDTSISALTDLVSGIQAYQQANAAAKKAGLATGLFTANGLQLAMVILGVIIKIVQAIAKMHDARIDKEIEQSKKKVDDLQKAYERLEKSIEKTFDTVSYIREYNQEVQNLNEQIEEANRQIAAAQDYKNAEKKKEAIEAAEDAKQEALDALEEIKQAQIEVFGGIGRDSYRSAAEGFVDAWKSAFLETGDGLQGLQDHFDEFLNDWFVKQATMRYAAAALEPVFKMIDDAVDQYGAGGANVVMQELEAIKEWARVNFPQISDTLEEISRPFIGEGEGSLSGLAAGIQGMTEEQANILEAYWNSVRGYTANIDMNVSRIAQILGAGGNNTNPMLAQMTLVAQNTNNIRTLLESVRFNGGEGVGIRVYSY